jgi:uncharacterized linocin/CFP29 family protein
MNFQRRELAPCSDAAWDAMEEAARDVLAARLVARRVVDVDGPHGWQFSAVSEGRIHTPPDSEGQTVRYAMRVVNPLVEASTRFELSRNELDDVARGALDPELAPLEEAAVAAALFEDKAVFSGLKSGGMRGLRDQSVHTVAKGTESYLAATARSVDLLQQQGIAGPYSLVLPSSGWRELVEANLGYPMERHIAEITGGAVLPSSSLEDAFVVSLRGGDFLLTLGQDFTLRYCSHTSEAITFDLVESFVFRAIDPRAIVMITA